MCQLLPCPTLSGKLVQHWRTEKLGVGGRLEYPKTGQPERQLSALVAVRELASNEAMPQPVLQFIPALDTNFAFC